LNIISLSFIFAFGSLFLCVLIIITSILLNNNKCIYIKNISINIGLIIFSGIIYLFYEKIFDSLFVERWPSMFTGIIVMFGIFVFNIVGISLSIINIKKIYLTLINYGLLIVSTVLIYNLINILGKTLENNKIVSECSSILLIGIIMAIENIFSYIIAKKIIKIEMVYRATTPNEAVEFLFLRKPYHLVKSKTNFVSDITA
jgi:hypothetical protein